VGTTPTGYPGEGGRNILLYSVATDRRKVGGGVHDTVGLRPMLRGYEPCFLFEFMPNGFIVVKIIKCLNPAKRRNDAKKRIGMRFFAQDKLQTRMPNFFYKELSFSY